MHREFWRKVNYEELLDVTGRMDVRPVRPLLPPHVQADPEEFWVSNTREKFGIDMATMAHLMKIKERSVYAFESFREFTDDPCHAARLPGHAGHTGSQVGGVGAQVPQGAQGVQGGRWGSRMAIGARNTAEAARATREAVDAVCKPAGIVTEQDGVK